MWRGVYVERRCGGIEVWKCVTVEYGGVQEKQLEYNPLEQQVLLPLYCIYW